MKLLKVLLLLLCILAFVPQPAPGQNSNSIVKRFRKSEGAIPNQYIVVFNESVPAARVEAFAKQLAHAHGGKVGFIYRSALRGFSVEMSEAQAVALSRNPHVEYVEEDALVEGAAVQSSPTWALDRLDQRELPLDAAYNYATSGAGVNAYIIDSGIRKTHEEFGGRVELAYDNVGDGRNGMDCFGHGTLVAGIVGSNTYGVAKGVKLHSVRVLDCNNKAGVTKLIAGMDWVIANSVKPAVANLSFMTTNVTNSSIDLAVRNLVASGVTTVVAAGNDIVDAGTRSPARVREAITVAASDMNDNRATFSNFGSVVDVFAPGVDITSTSNVNDTSTHIRSGTSFAAPFVTGLVARYLASRPGDQPDAVSQAITNSATPGKVINPGEGSPNLLAYTLSFTVNDNFNDSTRDETKWLAPASTDVSVTEQNGRLEITPAPNATSYDGYKSATNIDLTDARVSVQASIGQTIYGFGSYLVLSHSSTDYLVIGIGHHDLWVQQVVGGVATSASIPYDAVQHAFWRIRHNRADDTINWEASPDGATWTVLRTAPRPFPITNLQISFTAGKSDAATPTTTASFDNLLYEATAPPPPVNTGGTGSTGSTISDNFNDNTRDATRWLAPASTDVSVAEQNGRLEITPAPNATSYDGYKSATNIDLTDARVSVQDSIGQTTYGFGSYLVLSHSSTDYLVIGIAHHDLLVQQVVGGVASSTSVPYNAVQHAFWRIRHNRTDDTINWEASPDGATWTVLYAAPRPFPITDLQASLIAGKSEAATPSTTASFDNLLHEPNPIPPANSRPQVNAGLDATVNEGSAFSGTASFTDIDNNDTWTVIVDYGDGTGAQPVTPTPSKTIPLNHVYKDNAANPYTVTVTVTDAAGASSSDIALVTSVNVAPTAYLGPTPSTCPAGYRIKFYSSANEPSQTDREARLTYLWTVTKNGGAYVEPSADEDRDNYDITPQEEGTYVVSLRVTDKDGGVGTVSRTIIVTKIEPSDDFNDDWTNVARWYVLETPGVRVMEPQGQLHVETYYYASGYDGYYARNGIDLTNQRAMVEAVQPVFGDGPETYFVMADKTNSAQNRLTFKVGEARGYLRMEDCFTYCTNTQIPYDAAQHRFWRFRHDAATDTIKWETSPDCIQWTVRHTAPRRFSLTNMQAQLYAGRSTATTTPTTLSVTAIFDNYRVGDFPSPSTPLSDNFDDNRLDTTLWRVLNPVSPLEVREQNQRLEMARQSYDAYGNGVESSWSYNFWNKRVQVEISHVGEAASFFTLKLDEGNYYRMEIGRGQLRFDDRVDGVWNWYHITYSASAHRFLRFRHNAAANTMSFEASPDGQTWTTIKSVPVGLSLNSMKVELRGGGRSDTPGITVFDNLKMDASSSLPADPSIILSDDFNDNVRDTMKWNVNGTSGFSVVEQNSQVRITPPASATGNDGYYSTRNVDLTGAHATVELVQSAGVVADGIETTFKLVDPTGGSYMLFSVTRSGLVMEAHTPTNNHTSVVNAYDAALNRFLRIRHNAATNYVTFETSRDGQTWSTALSYGSNLTLTNLQIQLYAGKSTATAAANTAIFDNLRVQKN